MVEFSNRNEVARWLEGRPHRVALVIAARVALRVTPLLATALGPRRGGAKSVARDNVLPALRNLAAPWAAAKYQTSADVAAYAYGYSVADAAHEPVDTTATYDPAGTNDPAYAAAADAAYAAAFVHVYAHKAARYADAAATYAARAASAASAADAAAVYAAASADAGAIERGATVSALAGLPLWPNGEPDWSREQWTRLKLALISLNQDWEVWTDWYEARRDGRAADEALEIARVLIPDQIWAQGPAVVNAEIKRLIAEYEHQEREIFDSAWKDEPKQFAQPPEIPAPRRAAVEPIWQNGQLTIPRRPTKTDLTGKKFVAALSSLRSELRDFAGDISGEANIDKRFTSFVHRLAERIPDSAPSQDELFRLGHVEQVFAGYATTVDQEWPNFLAARFHALVLQFERTLRQSRLWREFKRNAAKETLTAEQLASAIPLAQEAAIALRSDEAMEFVDPLIPDTLDELDRTLPSSADEYPGGVIREGNELLAIDLIESVNNILKPIAEVALSAAADYTKGFGQGFKKAAKKQGPIDGAKAFKWLRRIVIGAGVGVGAAAGTFPALSQLISKYPQAFEWLNRVLHYLSLF